MTKEQLKEVNKAIGLFGLENVQNITIVKYGATNGDIIKNIFPKGIPKDIAWTLQGVKGVDWWNAPYKLESEENK